VKQNVGRKMKCLSIEDLIGGAVLLLEVALSVIFCNKQSFSYDDEKS
jgi:hypothetical protein